jgi:acyl carrier protein
MNATDDTVFALLAHHARHGQGDLHVWQHLSRDLHLTPLDLALIACELEDAEGVEVPVEDLANLHTVGELVSSLQRVVARAQRKVAKA